MSQGLCLVFAVILCLSRSERSAFVEEETSFQSRELELKRPKPESLTTLLETDELGNMTQGLQRSRVQLLEKLHEVKASIASMTVEISGTKTLLADADTDLQRLAHRLEVGAKRIDAAKALAARLREEYASTAQRAEQVLESLGVVFATPREATAADSTTEDSLHDDAPNSSDKAPQHTVAAAQNEEVSLEHAQPLEGADATPADLQKGPEATVPSPKKLIASTFEDEDESYDDDPEDSSSPEPLVPERRHLAGSTDVAQPSGPGARDSAKDSTEPDMRLAQAADSMRDFESSMPESSDASSAALKPAGLQDHRPLQPTTSALPQKSIAAMPSDESAATDPTDSAVLAASSAPADAVPPSPSIDEADSKPASAARSALPQATGSSSDPPWWRSFFERWLKSRRA